MKKLLLKFSAIAMLLHLSCNKPAPSSTITGGSGPGSTTTPTSSNRWIVGSRDFIVTDTTMERTKGNAVTFYDFQSSTLTLIFETYPSVSGDYRVVGSSPSTGEVYIGCGSILPRTGYWSSGTDSKKLTVTVTGGRRTFTCEKVMIIDRVTTPSKADTALLTTELIEP